MRRLFVLLLLVAAAAFSMSPVSAQEALPPADFAISVPAEPLTAGPNQAVETSIRVVNRTNQKAKFQLKGVRLDAQDEGRLQVTEGTTDWLTYLEIPPLVEVEPSSYAEVPIKLTVPANAAPDIYLVGFAVEPVRPRSGDSVEVKAQAVNHLAVEVPGEVHRSVAIKDHTVPRLIVGNKLKGHFDVYNDGNGGVRFRGQVFVDSVVRSQNLGVVQANDAATAELLPTQRSKTLDYEWSLGGRLFAFVRPTVEVDFTNGDRGIMPVKQRGPMILVVRPEALMAGGILVTLGLVGGVVLAIRRRRRRSLANPS